MQTFLPYSHFTMSAKVLDQKRLGKQRVETLQILKVLSCGPYQQWDEFDYENHWKPCPASKYKPKVLGLRKTPWYNHPAVQMWKGYEASLMLYLKEMCQEWVSRGFKDTCLEKATELNIPQEHCLLPNWVGNERFHKSHQSNLLRKNPEHYGQFFMGVPSDLPYVWPSKENL